MCGGKFNFKYLYIKKINIMEQDKKSKNFIKTTIREFLNENKKTKKSG
jgi:DNA-directed RNA polymerase specialized sigma54-like protein